MTTDDPDGAALPLADVTRLFDHLPDVVFFVKDRHGRYAAANRTLALRCGLDDPERLLARTAAEVFPEPLGAAYLAQDLEVMATGREVRDHLELHLYPGGARGWCLTSKRVLRGTDGGITGLTGLSRDVQRPDERGRDYRGLAGAIRRITREFDQPLRLSELAQDAGLSEDSFARMVQRVFGLTPRQLLTRTRIDAATRLLRETDQTVAQIALACGYGDHSAFTRQFRAAVGLTPRECRQSR